MNSLKDPYSLQPKASIKKGITMADLMNTHHTGCMWTTRVPVPEDFSTKKQATIQMKDILARAEPIRNEAHLLI